MSEAFWCKTDSNRGVNWGSVGSGCLYVLLKQIKKWSDINIIICVVKDEALVFDPVKKPQNKNVVVIRGSFTVHSNQINLTWKISSTTTEHCDLEESQILNFVLNNFVVFLNNIVTISIVVVVGRSENSWILTSDMFPLKFTLKRSVNYSNCCWLLIYIHWTNQLLISAIIGRSVCTKKSCIFCQIITMSLFVKPQKTSEFPRMQHSSVPHGSRVTRPGLVTEPTQHLQLPQSSLGP